MRKFLAIIMAVAMMATLVCVVSAVDDSKVIVKYTFDNGAESGLEEVGEGLTYADGAVTFGGGAYLKTGLDLSGVEALSVAFRVKPTGSTSWPFEITSEESHAYKTEHYLGVLLNTGIVAERYGFKEEVEGRPDRPGNIVVGDVGTDYLDVVIVYPNDGTTIVYINGEEAGKYEGTDSEAFDLSIANCVGETPELHIGWAAWNEASDGMVLDELVVYNTALTADEVATALSATGKAPQTGFATIALAIAAIGSGAYIVSKKNH